jgi:integrase
MAHTQKRNGRWQARYRGPDGKERARHFDRKVDAQRWLDTNGADLARGTWVDPDAGKVTFANYAKTWMTTKADVSARTRINIEGRLNNHAIPHFGNVAMNSIRPSHIRTLVADLTAAGRSPSTVRAVYLTVSQVFAQAVGDDVIGRTPCREITLPKEAHGEEKHFLTPAQVNTLGSAIDDRYRALIYTAAYSGLRAGELAGLEVDSVDVLAGSIFVSGAASEVRGQLVLGPTKTGKKRTVAIPRFLAQMIGEHLGRYPSDTFVFTAREGGPIRHRNFYRRHFRPAVETAHERDQSIPLGLRFHDLRHTCAALLIADGRHMEEVKDHLGHSSIRVTSDRYGHLFPSARQALAEGLEAVFQKSAAASSADSVRTGAAITALRPADETAV